MDEYNEIIATNKSITSFVVKGEIEHVIVPAKSAIMITNLIISNSGSGSIEIFARTAKEYDFSKETSEQIFVPIVKVEAGQVFNFVDATGLTFWRDSEIVVKSSETQGIVTIGYLRVKGEDLNMWNHESVTLEGFKYKEDVLQENKILRRILTKSMKL